MMVSVLPAPTMRFLASITRQTLTLKNITMVFQQIWEGSAIYCVSYPTFTVGFVQITKYVINEILNHSRLRHPHIVNFREVCLSSILDLPDYSTDGLGYQSDCLVVFEHPLITWCLTSISWSAYQAMQAYEFQQLWPAKRKRSAIMTVILLWK